jgi:parvulin-like peptidyl-prolyl isomerase
MKNIFAAFLLLLAIPVVAQQTVTEQFQKINTIQQAEQYIAANAQLKPALMYLSAGKDSGLLEKRLLRQKQGDVFSVGNVTYKILDVKDTINFRASYIFLDGGTYTKSQIDSLKNVIMKKISAGESFEALSDQYTMDGNQTRGDTDWFYGEYMMPKEFQDAVQKNKTGDVFFLDVSEKQWHYIIKKTHDDRIKKDVIVLRSNGR